MSLTDMDLAPDEDQALANAMLSDVGNAIGNAIDLAVGVKEELFKDVPNGLIGFIKSARETAIASVALIPTMNLEDKDKAIAVLRDIQRDLDVYSRAVAFAGSALTGYIGAGDEADDESVET